MCKKIICGIGIIICICSITLAGIQTYRLERIRYEYLHLREQYERVIDKQQEITDIITGTGDILQESIDSIGQLKRVIGQIRENYEKMESVLNSLNYSSSDSNNSLESEGEVE